MGDIESITITVGDKSVTTTPGAMAALANKMQAGPFGLAPHIYRAEIKPKVGFDKDLNRQTTDFNISLATTAEDLRGTPWFDVLFEDVEPPQDPLPGFDVQHTQAHQVESISLNVEDMDYWVVVVNPPDEREGELQLNCIGALCLKSISPKGDGIAQCELQIKGLPHDLAGLGDGWRGHIFQVHFIPRPITSETQAVSK